MNEPLRRALLRARLREGDVAARLDVDPKTVRRWLNGRVPYPHNRAAIAELVGVDEADLWPDAGGPLAARVRPEELGTVYPHRWVVPREAWARLFGSAEREIAILAYSALVNQHTYGIPAAQAPVFCLCDAGAARWPPSTSTASSASGLVPRRSHSAADQRKAVGRGDGSTDCVVR